MDGGRKRWLLVGPVGSSDLAQVAMVPAGTVFVGHEVRMYGHESWFYFEGDEAPQPIAPFRLVSPDDVKLPKG